MLSVIDNEIGISEEELLFLGGQKRVHRQLKIRQAMYEAIENGLSMWRDSSESDRKEPTKR